MHLKSYPKLVRSELRVDSLGVPASQRSSSGGGGVFVSQQGALLRTCGSNHGNISSSRLPLSVISTNTLRRANATNSSSSVRAGCENDSLRLYQEDADGPLDIWTVIKPGHVREKIAIFASDGERANGAGSNEHTTAVSPDRRDRTPSVCVNHGAVSGPCRAVKAKGSWEENCRAKRRRRSGNNQNLQQDPRTRVQNTQQHAIKPSPQRSDSPGGGGQCGGEAAPAVEEEEQQKVSVGEMVAFLEQRASETQPDSKPLLALQRSSTTITLSRAPPPEVRGEEPESVKVSDMVAKLESECLRRRTEGDLSRSNSLRRAVGRVLLAAAEQSPAPCDHSPAPCDHSPAPCQPSSLSGAPGADREPISCSETPAALTTPPSETEAPPITQAPPPPSEEVEPLPGLLFLSQPPAASEPRPPRHRTTLDLEPAQPRPPTARCDQSEKRRRRRKADRGEEEMGGAVVRRASASQDFLLMRQRLQQLLEPQPFLAVLPHHLLLHILLLLPTQSLAALKCTCHYFKFIIDTYGVRPADSLWVSDPRYRDDPCKQCKKRYGRGDVSLCRWHHKPYCQALPYGPGYWMCCHGAHRDAPGCNVGLHDNRWVPAFHSINVPIYRRSRDDD